MGKCVCRWCQCKQNVQINLVWIKLLYIQLKFFVWISWSGDAVMGVFFFFWSKSIKLRLNGCKSKSFGWWSHLEICLHKKALNEMLSQGVFDGERKKKKKITLHAFSSLSAPGRALCMGCNHGNYGRTTITQQGLLWPVNPFDGILCELLMLGSCCRLHVMTW